jgi:hypothetical protein
MKNVSVWYRQNLKAHSSTKHLRLIQGINNYPRINTYWSCIVRIGIFINMTSSMFLLASKKCFLTRQGCRGWYEL